MKLTLQQLEAHLWGAANILRGKTAGQDYKNYILSLMFFKRLCDQWEDEADDAIAELEREQGRSFTEQQKAVFRKRGEHRFNIPDGSRWGDVKAASTNIGEVLTTAMRAVAHANDELRGVFTVDWNQPAPDGSGKPLIPNEVVHALVQHAERLVARLVPFAVGSAECSGRTEALLGIRTGAACGGRKFTKYRRSRRPNFGRTSPCYARSPNRARRWAPGWLARA